jgi:hypothetical protein
MWTFRSPPRLQGCGKILSLKFLLTTHSAIRKSEKTYTCVARIKKKFCKRIGLLRTWWVKNMYIFFSQNFLF